MDLLLCLVLAYVYGSFAEHLAHRYIMHVSRPGLEDIYKDHRVHHAVFRRGTFFKSKSPKKFFNLVVCLEHNFFLSLPGAILAYPFCPLLSYSLLTMGVIHFFMFNRIHFGMHLRHRLPQNGFINHLTWNHMMHHNHPTKFFCVVMPGADWLMGTTCPMTMKDKRDWINIQNELRVDKDQVEDDKERAAGFNFCKLPRMFRDFENLKSKFMIKTFIGDIKIIGEKPQDVSIICGNHPSWLDVFVITYTFPDVHLMAHDSVLKWLKWILPPSCYSHKNGIAQSIQFLSRGESVILLPEGWTSLTGKMLQFHTGALVISNTTNIPIIPVRIKYNSYRGEWITQLPPIIQWIIDGLLPRKSRGVTVIVGKPFTVLQDNYHLEANRLRATVQSLLPLEVRPSS